MRSLFTLLHRWTGLALAAFLCVAGLTGAVISWDHELDAWLNPQLFSPRGDGPARPVAELVAAVEAADARVRVTYHPLAVEPDHTFVVFVAPRLDPATGRLFAVDYNQVAVDPASATVQGRRLWGAVSLQREHLLPFLYKLHYSLHLPEQGGLAWGVLLMGGVAIAWLIDTLVALWLSFPSPAQWRKSLVVRWRAGGHKRVFDLHRSGGVWLFVLLLPLALTSVAMNLRQEVVRPLVEWFSPLTPSPFASRAAAPVDAPIEPLVSSAQVLQQAQAEAARRGWTDPPGAVFLSTDFGIWGVGFFPPGRAHGDGGLGNPWLYYDSRSGEPAGAEVPGSGSWGDVFLQSMFPLHSGRILGLPGRVLVSLLGLCVAGLSITGVLIWARKRRARRRAAAALDPGRSSPPRVVADAPAG